MIITSINETDVEISDGKITIEVLKENFEEIDLPTSWAIKDMGKNVTITSNPKTRIVSITNRDTKDCIVCKSAEYMDAIRKYKMRKRIEESK